MTITGSTRVLRLENRLVKASGPSLRSSRELWTILLGRSALRELNQIEAELNKHWQRLLAGLSYYRPPSSSSAEKVKANKDVASPLKELGLRISKFLGLDEEQSVQLLHCYLQEDYRGTRDSLKVCSCVQLLSAACIFCPCWFWIV
uniref:Nucleoporin 188 n=1 Tax=Oryctolagus cuniculus TaxID=9986 RepID=A0A5F9D3M5_RABIT